MKPETRSKIALGITRSKAKMYEYDVPQQYHINIPIDPARLLVLALGVLGEFSARSNDTAGDKSGIVDLRDHLRFSAHFFDSYFNSRLDSEIDEYLIIAAAASYYLCGLPGSSIVLTRMLDGRMPDLGCHELEQVLLWLLRGDFSEGIEVSGRYDELVAEVLYCICEFYESGHRLDEVINGLSRIRETAYREGTARELLFADVVCAVCKRRLFSSTWFLLPQYTNLAVEYWEPVLSKAGFLRELWPSQQMLGENGIYSGNSAVVQMPTSAGKTKSTEIIIRSAFLSGRASMAVIVAPFRALCHEIRSDLAVCFSGENVRLDEISDAPQLDFDVFALMSALREHDLKSILVLTPEKLMYMLRQSPDLAADIGLVIYDEGHQFDNGARGITYELLLASLKNFVPEKTQTVLISAVISNASEVSGWLHGNDQATVSAPNLLPTHRSIAFTSWRDQLGRLEFVDTDDPDRKEYFVPRLLEEEILPSLPREKNARYFPDKSDGKNIAVFFATKLIAKGGVAIFCGNKASVLGICKAAVDIFRRRNDIPRPSAFSNAAEVEKLACLHLAHLGPSSPVTKCSNLGLYAHSGNTPHGLRLAIEHAMQKGLIKSIICTSTLAQGVNLPIKYLLVTSVYQAGERIKVRDFHNLIGRAGRSGKYTEGSIIFTDPIVFDGKRDRDESWRWYEVKKLLNPQNSEPCGSTIKSLFSPIYSDSKKYFEPFDVVDFVEKYVAWDELRISAFVSDVVRSYISPGFSQEKVSRQIKRKLDIIAGIESYLLAHWQDQTDETPSELASSLAIGTFAYFISDDESRERLQQVFTLIAEGIQSMEVQKDLSIAFGKTLYGLKRSLELKNWVADNLKPLISSRTHEEIIEVLWTLLRSRVDNKTFSKLNPTDSLKDLLLHWTFGDPYHKLHKLVHDSGAWYKAGTQQRAVTLEHVIDVCENGFGFDGTQLVAAVTELYSLALNEVIATAPGTVDLTFERRKLAVMQKRIKYGLPSDVAVVLFELGFADRVIALGLANRVLPSRPLKDEVVLKLREEREDVLEYLSDYPSFYTTVLHEVLGRE